ncbi:hypothetical protein GCM10009680_54830 [Streptomyces yatensis]|uniref:Uncharacterized protein n=1 Tax=Streptomyces yatensis TaxID=155177 RepID=A0ABP4UK87_9ACTN
MRTVTPARAASSSTVRVGSSVPGVVIGRASLSASSCSVVLRRRAAARSGSSVLLSQHRCETFRRHWLNTGIRTTC